MKNKILPLVLAILLIASIVLNVYLYRPYIFGKAHYGDTIAVFTNYHAAEGDETTYDMYYAMALGRLDDAQVKFVYLSFDNSDYHQDARLDAAYYDEFRQLINDSDLFWVTDATRNSGSIFIDVDELEAPIVVVIGEKVYTTSDTAIIDFCTNLESRCNSVTESNWEWVYSIGG